MFLSDLLLVKLAHAHAPPGRDAFSTGLYFSTSFQVYSCEQTPNRSWRLLLFFFFFNIKFLSDELVAVFLFVCFNNFSVVSNMIFKCTGIHNSYYFRLGTAPFFCCLWKTILCQNHGLCLNEQDTWFELFRNWLQNVVLAN